MDSDLRVVSKSSSLEGTVVVGVDHAAVEVSVGSHSGLLVPEPLSSDRTQVGRSHMTDSSRHFRSWDHSIKVGHLSCVLIAHVAGAVVFKQVVEVSVPGSENLRVVELNNI